VRGFDFYTISPFVFIPYSTTTTITYYNPQLLDSHGLPTPVQLPVNVLEFVPIRPGGDTQAIGNFEYRIPIYQNYVTLSIFNDFGIVGLLRHSQLQLDPSATALLQEQYPNADFPLCPPSTENTPQNPCVTIPRNLQIASSTNFRPHTSAGLELGIQIPIIQAPFRIYYAYNYLRFDRTVDPPLGAFYIPPEERLTLQELGVYDSQIVPTLFAPHLGFLERTRSSETVAPSLFEAARTLRFAVSRTF